MRTVSATSVLLIMIMALYAALGSDSAEALSLLTIYAFGDSGMSFEWAFLADTCTSHSVRFCPLWASVAATDRVLSFEFYYSTMDTHIENAFLDPG